MTYFSRYARILVGLLVLGATFEFGAQWQRNIDAIHKIDQSAVARNWAMNTGTREIVSAMQARQKAAIDELDRIGAAVARMEQRCSK